MGGYINECESGDEGEIASRVRGAERTVGYWLVVV